MEFNKEKYWVKKSYVSVHSNIIRVHVLLNIYFALFNKENSDLLDNF